MAFMTLDPDSCRTWLAEDVVFAFIAFIAFIAFTPWNFFLQSCPLASIFLIIWRYFAPSCFKYSGFFMATIAFIALVVFFVGAFIAFARSLVVFFMAAFMAFGGAAAFPFIAMASDVEAAEVS